MVSSIDFVPLVVDIDGTLLRSDLLVESAFAMLARDIYGALTIAAALAKGRAQLKAEIAMSTDIDVTHLPYCSEVLAMIQTARDAGRKIYLASASDERYVKAIADHLGLFDGWFASNGTENLSSQAKARRLVDAFGERGFDYVGNDRADLLVWEVSRKGWAVYPSSRVRRALSASGVDVTILDPLGGRAMAWIKLMRVHQWAKNGLVFVPLLASQSFAAAALTQEIGAFFAFSFAASAVYILNDLVDLEADRKHPTKKFRPLAAGAVPILASVPLAALLVVLACGVALAVKPLLAGILLVYLALTTAYTLSLKRKMLIDIIVLAALYAIRVIGGAAAISVPVSEWLLGFSMFIFLSVALIKRYVELAARIDEDLPDPSNRNYRKSDLSVIGALAAAAGFNSITIFALYISSDKVALQYAHPKALWLICPILTYWIARALMMAHRRHMDDDPVLFALKDRNSQLALAIVGAILLVAISPL
jgi:4-hydroxybenzoate polyprenyltransferase/phosphoserine phosphatase